MTRSFRQEIDEGIVDRAAELFARRGFAKTSVQDVAAAVGLSKAGLLHHFPTKDALYERVEEQALALGARVLTRIGDLSPGIERDRQAIEALVEVALTRPGLVSMLITTLTTAEDADAHKREGSVGALAFSAFGVDVTTDPDPQRLVRVTGALASLAFLSVAAARADQADAWRAHIVATSFDALGHHHAGAPDRSTQAEA